MMAVLPLALWLNFSPRYGLPEVTKYFKERIAVWRRTQRLTREERARVRERDRLLREREELKERAADGHRRLGEIERRLEVLAGEKGPYRSSHKIRASEDEFAADIPSSALEDYEVMGPGGTIKYKRRT